MLVLTRKLGEVIRIGSGVTVRVLEIKGSQVRLGLDAPPDVKIFREEVYRAILNENAGAALGSLDTMDAATTAVRKHKGGANGVEDKLGR